ncbi:COP9 signalosome subunit CSN8 [Gregarina niphandrodes]|uniref:COP9 signalosome subunit CSN8 n=1 Tax=Gregarina niphandrodes TaxID=110365 RepID=A0A023BC83_GRENI|nr:COP9 signalosome subunit CSN8 [Gregarina niphandrodes]EZG83060.1 COP9 signalosome subunit CSN8 [Gregarina niphandrodes]|eukprot:XP_011128964.1 COP9 signalosome subunit CSN8 [Gregarina niphandrodes]
MARQKKGEKKNKSRTQSLHKPQPAAESWINAVPVKPPAAQLVTTTTTTTTTSDPAPPRPVAPAINLAANSPAANSTVANPTVANSSTIKLLADSVQATPNAAGTAETVAEETAGDVQTRVAPRLPGLDWSWVEAELRRPYDRQQYARLLKDRVARWPLTATDAAMVAVVLARTVIRDEFVSSLLLLPLHLRGDLLHVEPTLPSGRLNEDVDTAPCTETLTPMASNPPLSQPTQQVLRKMPASSSFYRAELQSEEGSLVRMETLRRLVSVYAAMNSAWTSNRIPLFWSLAEADEDASALVFMFDETETRVRQRALELLTKSHRSVASDTAEKWLRTEKVVSHSKWVLQADQTYLII